MLAAFGQLAESIIGRVNQFVRPCREILYTDGDGLAAPILAKRRAGSTVERSDGQSPSPCHVDERERVQEPIRLDVSAAPLPF